MPASKKPTTYMRNFVFVYHANQGAVKGSCVIRDTTLDAALAKFYATFLKLHVTITSITDEENTQ